MTITRRNLAASIIFTIITCGIYGLFWAYFMGKEAIRVYDEDDSGTLEIVLMILLPFIGFFLMERKFYEAHQRMGITNKSDNSIIYLILGIFGLAIIDYALFQNDLNKLADKFDDGLTPVYEVKGAAANSGSYSASGASTAKTTANRRYSAIDPVEAIKMLADLKDQGILTQQEFDEKKQKYLDMI